MLARSTIALDGRYGFYDVLLPSRQGSKVEIYLYDRHNTSVPVAIEDRTRNTSDFLLSGGALVHQVGVGYHGNLLQSQIDDFDTGTQSAGFYQSRWGINDNLTVEVAAQRAADQNAMMGGLVTRLGNDMVVSLAMGAANGAYGVNAELDGVWPNWQLRARSQLHRADYRRADSEETFDHVVEISHSRSVQLDLGLIARSRKLANDQTDYLLPLFAWRPVPGVGLRARPDEQGQYVADVSWQISPRTRVAGHFQSD